jgi:hypothetical protein
VAISPNIFVATHFWELNEGKIILMILRRNGQLPKRQLAKIINHSLLVILSTN